MYYDVHAGLTWHSLNINTHQQLKTDLSSASVEVYEEMGFAEVWLFLRDKPVKQQRERNGTNMYTHNNNLKVTEAVRMY